MEFPFNINHLFGDSIFVVDRNLRPYRSHSHGNENLQVNLQTVIDEMGQASSKAQGLNHVITTARRMQFTDNKLYVVTDPAANRGCGAAVGILKTGRKNLFVLDRHGNQTEMQPICILDFYVHESCQRKGYGKKLFEYMLQDEGVKPQHLAIDRPSHKFLSFLAKHYNLRATISQVNNFVIFDGFFTNQPESSYCRRRGMGKPPVPPNHKASHRQSPSHATTGGVWPTDMSPASRRRKEMRSPSRGSLSSAGSDGGIAGLELTGLDISTRGLGAQASSYSRYNQQTMTPPVPRRGSAGARGAFFGSSPILGGPEQDNGSPFTLRRRNSWDNPRQSPTTNSGSQPSRTVDSSPPPFGHPSAFSVYNSHLQTTDRHGHLKVSPNSTNIQATNGSNMQQTNKAATETSNPGSVELPSLNPTGNYVISYSSPQNRVLPSSFNVFGVPPSQKQQQGGGPNQNSSYNGGTAHHGSPSHMRGGANQNSPLIGGSTYQNAVSQGSPSHLGGSANQNSPFGKGSGPYTKDGVRNQHWSSNGIF